MALKGLTGAVCRFTTLHLSNSDVSYCDAKNNIVLKLEFRCFENGLLVVSKIGMHRMGVCSCLH